MPTTIEHRERKNAGHRRWRARYPERVKAAAARSYLRHRDARRQANVFHQLERTWRTHGLTLDQFHALYESQDMACAVCGDELSTNKQAIHIDHCHRSGRVRGLLCGGCNVGLGMFRDEPQRMQRAIAYVTEHHRKVSK